MRSSVSTLHKVLCFILNFFVVQNIYSQSFFVSNEKGALYSKYFSTKVYNAGTQNWAIVEDSRGVMFFGNIAGVLEFNGSTWNLIQNTNASAVRSLAIDDNGVVLAGGFNEIGYLKPNKWGKLEYKTLNSLIDSSCLDFGEVWDIYCIDGSSFFLTDKFVFRLENGIITCWPSKNNSYYLSFKVNNRYFVHELNVGLQEHQNGKLMLVPKGDFFKDMKIHSVFPHKNGLLICTRNNGFFTYTEDNGNVTVSSISVLSKQAREVNSFLTANSYYHGIQLSNGNLALGVLSGEVIIVNSNWEVVDVINHRTIGIKSAPYFLYQSSDGNLWICLDNGICLVEIMSPFRYWNEERGVSGVLTGVARGKDMLYFSTGTGIFYSRINNSATFDLSEFSSVKEDFDQPWGFEYFQPNSSFIKDSMPFDLNKTILLAATRKGLFSINGSVFKRISDYEGVFCAHHYRSNPNKLLLGTTNGVAVLHYDKGAWSDQGFHFNITSSINDIAEDSIGNLWFNSDFYGVYRIKNPFHSVTDSVIVEKFSEEHGLPSIRSVRLNEEEYPVLFYTQNVFYQFIDSISMFKEYVFDEESDSTLNNRFGESLNLVWNRYNYDIISQFYTSFPMDSAIWFSTNKGVTRFKPIHKRNFSRTPNTIVTKVWHRDSVFFYGTNYKSTSDCDYCKNGALIVDTSRIVNIGTNLKYEYNSLAFNYSMPFFEGESPVKYSFMLVGYDKEWSEWTEETKKEYTNLSSGRYTFKVKGKNIYNVESLPAEFHFVMQPPWYATIYAYLVYFVLIFLTISLIVRLYTLRLIREKDKLEKIVKERTQEILQQKEEILVQAEHLKEANEWMKAKNVELEDQKRELERKKNLLELSDATKNKFFRIIAHDLRSPVSTVVSSTDFIISSFSTFDKEKIKRYVENLHGLSLTTFNLLENLLDWSSDQMGDMPYRPEQLDVEVLLSEGIELVNSRLELKQISVCININEPITVYADEEMVRTVIRNLLSNAVKFTNNNGQITISAECDAEMCYLTIEDNGVGISSENIENLFKVDKDVRTLGTHKEKGSGLGLILCKEFVERNGGTIKVNSTQGIGSRFTVSLKLA